MNKIFCPECQNEINVDAEQVLNEIAPEGQYIIYCDNCEKRIKITFEFEEM